MEIAEQGADNNTTLVATPSASEAGDEVGDEDESDEDDDVSSSGSETSQSSEEAGRGKQSDLDTNHLSMKCRASRMNQKVSLESVQSLQCERINRRI